MLPFVKWITPLLVCGAFVGARGADLRETLEIGGVRLVESGEVVIRGRSEGRDGTPVLVTVCDGRGAVFRARSAVSAGAFSVEYPKGFSGAPPLCPGMLYVDAVEFPQTEADSHRDDDARRPDRAQGEIAIVVSGERGEVPDLPQVFMDDLTDGRGNRDRDSAQWVRTRGLMNHFMRSAAASRMGLWRPRFDLADSESLEWFKRAISIFEFDHRDRDWSRPLGNRVACGFWQAVWDRWFNPSNDHPWDGNVENRSPQNYRPYTFANDLADLLVLNRMLLGAEPAAADRRRALGDEVLQNLLAMQHRDSDNFAVREVDGRRETYTRGAFRYGLFETGEWLVEGTGWFVNPRHRDFAGGGVFNGRSVWALGEALKADPRGPHAGMVREAIRAAVRFCLRDSVALGYARRTNAGGVIWNRSDGEHAYLLLGLLAACEADALMECEGADGEMLPLKRVVCEALDALTETAGSNGLWSRYGNGAAMDIAALSLGAMTFPNESRSAAWRAAAVRAADRWMEMPVKDGEPTWETPMFAHMIADGAEGQVTFHLGREERAHVSLYMGGHWIHALALLHGLTGQARYAQRAHAILAYYLGNNPLRVRLLSEIGAVNNRVTDSDGDGVEDALHWDAYPESTAFVQIGLIHLLKHCPQIPQPKSL
jgi:hypothetical protein